MQELTTSPRKEIDFICLVTEPSTIRHRLSGIPRHYNSIPIQKENSPRAAIFTSPSIPIQEISNLSHRDLAVGLIKCGSKQTAIISAYMDIKAKPVTEQLQTTIDYCKSKGYSILLTADTNSHSKLWGNETNTRGKNGKISLSQNTCYYTTREGFQLLKARLENQSLMSHSAKGCQIH